MAWSFRKRIKVIPGVHLNFSKSGISTSVGVRGASMTFGNSGTYLNTSIPPLGIYNRQNLSKSLSNSFQGESNIIENSDNIFSADIQEITSQNKQGIKEAIIIAQQQRKELKNDLLEINTSYVSSKLKLNLSYILLYGLIKKTISQNIKEDIKESGMVIDIIRVALHLPKNNKTTKTTKINE